MSERLETVARQLGLKFMVHSTNPSTNNFYISTETFYLEICIDHTGSVMHWPYNTQQFCKALNTAGAGDEDPPPEPEHPEQPRGADAAPSLCTVTD